MDSHYDSNKIAAPTEEVIAECGSLLREGKLVVIPTETVYGLAANAFDPKACARIFEAKKRPDFDPLICHIASFEMLDQLAAQVPAATQKLIEKFWPGPLTVVLPKKEHVPDIVTSGLATVAVRMPSHPVALKLIQSAATPLAAPSANLFGKLSPTRPEHALPLAEHVAMIIDGGPSPVGVESTIVREIDGKIHILRPGGITPEEIEKTSGLECALEEHNDLPDAPGQLLSHYAPEHRVRLINEGERVETPEDAALLVFSRMPDQHFKITKVLSPERDLTVAASRLFEYLHLLDSEECSTIYVEKVPLRGIGIAIMNRLKKAAYEN